MKRYALVTLVALIAPLLDGCVGGPSGPKDNQDFSRISKLAELEGVYKNEGDNGNINTDFPHYLSENIWGYKSNWGGTSENLPPGVHHKNIEFIEVTSTDNTLTAKAIQKGCVVYEMTYTIRKDFELKDGQLVIHKNTNLLSRGGRDLALGPSYEEVSLGIDTGKQGKARSTMYAAVLFYMVIPIVAAGATSDVRYERVSDKPQGFKTCENR